MAEKKKQPTGNRPTCASCYYCQPSEARPGMGYCVSNSGAVAFDEDGSLTDVAPLVQLTRWSCRYFVPVN